MPARGPGEAAAVASPREGHARPAAAGEELARWGSRPTAAAWGAEVSSAVEVRLKEKLTCGPHTSVREGREVAGVFWTIRKYTGLRVGPRASKTYKMARFKEERNVMVRFKIREL